MKKYTSLNSVANIHDARQALMTADDLKEAGEAADYIFNKVAMMYKYPLNDLTRESERLKANLQVCPRLSVCLYALSSLLRSDDALNCRSLLYQWLIPRIY